MIYHILECSIQNESWKKLTVKEGVEEGKLLTNISINKMAKDNVTPAWPNWEVIVVGGTVEADYWASPKGVGYLFAPKPKQDSRSSSGASGVKAAQERKADMIEKAQDNKNTSIMIASAMRDAMQVALAALKDQPFPSDKEFMDEFMKWRTWYISVWKQTEKEQDVPFN